MFKTDDILTNNDTANHSYFKLIEIKRQDNKATLLIKDN